MDFSVKIIADLDASRVQKQLANLTKDQKMDIVADVAIKNKNALDSLMNDVNQLQSRLAKDFNINITSRQAVQAFNQIDKSISKTQKQIQSIQSDYWKQTFDNQFASRHTTSPELKEMRSYYSQLEKESLQVQKQIQSIQKQASSGLFEYRNAKNRSFLDRYVGQDSEALSRARKQIEEIKNLQSQISSGNLDGDKLTSLYAQLNEQVEKLSYSMRQVAEEQSKTLAVGVADTSANKVKSYMEANTKALSKYRAELESLEKSYRSMTTQGEKLDLDNQFRNLQSRISSEGLTGKSAIDDFKRASGQIAQFAGAYGLIQNVAFDVPRQMWSAVRDIDASMTSLQMATGVSNDRAKELMSTYAELGTQLKATSTDIATSATEWLKQGQSIENSNKLAQSSIVLSKIGDISSEDATSTITAAMKSYDIGVDEVMDFVDKISAIDMASATDVGGLANAFNEVAANARNAGVEADKLLAYAAVIGETTQEGMASVGTSLNAIFSRMGNIKLSRLKDPETGEDLSNTETSLRNVGIQLRESTGEFRDFDEVLDEVAANWQNYSEVTQRSIASSLAGTHHMNEIMVLMQNYSDVQKYMNEAANSSGTSMQKYEAYTDSLAGKFCLYVQKCA